MSEESRARALQLERDLKEVLAGWLTPGSGSKAIKGDVKSWLFLAEAKYRSRQDQGRWVMPLDCQWLEAIVRHAARDRRVPLLALEWGSGERRALLPADDYQQLTAVEGQDRDETALALPLRDLPLRITLLDCPRLTPASYHFERLEVPRRHWVALSWKELALLRREHPAVKESPRPRRIDSGKPASRFPKRPFPRRRKE